MTTVSSTAAHTVAVATQDPVIGRALTLLLEGLGYDVRCLPDPGNQDGESLTGVRLVVVVPSPGSELHRVMLASFKSLDAAGIPVLELGAASGRAGWPWRTEDLRVMLDDALRSR